MNVKYSIVFAGALVMGGAFAAAQVAESKQAAESTQAAEKVSAETEESGGLSWVPGEGVSFGEQSIVSAEVGLQVDSKFMSYGLVDNKDPILTPSAALTFFDWATFEVSSIFDLTTYGRRAGYSNRAGRYQELDPGFSLGHSFGPDDCEWLPTTIEFSLGYLYEYHPGAMGHSKGEWGEDTSFITAEVGLPDLWIEPTFYYERDVDRDNGTYLNLELGHTFALIEDENEGEDPILAFRPSVAQGFGNSQRVRGYLCKDWDAEEPLDHAGLMDTCIKGELTWNVGGGVSFSGYVAYYDFLFDSQVREAARGYEALGRDDESWNFVGGLAITIAF